MFRQQNPFSLKIKPRKPYQQRTGNESIFHKLMSASISFLLCFPLVGGCTFLPSNLTPLDVKPSPTVHLPSITFTEVATSTATFTPTFTNTPTPEPTKVDEIDLHPLYVETITIDYQGVKITTNIITDASIDPSIKKIFLNKKFKNAYGENSEEAISHFTAWTFFHVWWTKGLEKHSGSPTKEAFNNFMQLWSKAQQSNDPSDWKKVQFQISGVNDLNDGLGYKKKNIDIWPMYDGPSPEGVVGISEFNIAPVRIHSVKNITIFEWSGWDCGMGTNLNGSKLYIYVDITIFQGDLGPITYLNLSQRLITIPSWLANSNGRTLNETVRKMIFIKPNRSALNIDPESQRDRK
jgi:hypothetical protein